MNKVLPDTNALAPLLNGDENASAFFREVESLVLCAPVCAALIFGALKSSRRQENLERLSGFFESCEFLSMDRRTAEQFGYVRLELFEVGKPIPVNDLWIASLAKQHGLPVVTFDEHFRHVPKLEILRW